MLQPGIRTFSEVISIDREAKKVKGAEVFLDFIDKNRSRTALIIGGGFIGIEMAENLTKLGIKVTLVEKLNQVFHHYIKK